MPIVYEKLMKHRIAPVRQRYTTRDSIFYALSVGFGCDPLDERQLDFVDHHRALRAVPTMAIVLGYPGFWLRDPATGVDAVRLVHGEQSITWHAPLSSEGEVIGESHITGLVDKGAGKGALLYSEKRLVDAATGTLIATTTSTTFLRGDGGFGGPSGPVKAPHAMPQTAPEIVCDLPTRPEQALWYRMNGDDNPLHADPETARKAGFPRPILHGLCTLGVVAHALLRERGAYDPARMKSLELRFFAPVFPGETIRTEIWRDGSFRAHVVERDSIVINNGKAVFA